jgi:hypothetical protein
MPDLGWMAGAIDGGRLARGEAEAQRRLLLDALRQALSPAHPGAADRQQLLNLDDEVGPRDVHFNDGRDLVFAAESLDVLAWDSIFGDRRSVDARRRCRQAFSLARATIPTGNDASIHLRLLHVACLGWLADETSLAARLLADRELPLSSWADGTWGNVVRSGVVDAWLLLLRKRGWIDIDALLAIIAQLRGDQGAREEAYLSWTGADGRSAAWELMANYHLLRSAELVTEYLITGSIIVPGQPSVRYDVRERVQSHMDRAAAAAGASGDIALETLARLLTFVADQILENSLWTVARAVNPQVTRFVEALVSRNRTNPLFEALPPQRQALAEAGLARSGHRSIIVSLPTSAGKTLIAQFRILQALNAYDQQYGWAAYVAPNRALVNQIARRLRRDFAPLGIVVEKVSPALEVDGIEASLLAEHNRASQFRVLVTTPEKLDLLLRSGWQSRINRPLCLVVVDEAHNLASQDRGIKLELLLATINREARDAQFLLLTPFVRNAAEVAAWLDPGSNQAVSLALDWQPNDRIIALARRKHGDHRGDYSLELETLVTSRDTLVVDHLIGIGPNRPLGQVFSDAGSPGKLAAATASALSPRGATITLAQRPDHAWSLALDLRSGRSHVATPDEQVGAVQEVVRQDFGDDFVLADLLSYGIGVHHSGLSDELRVVVEWLLETGRIQHVVATTTMAQGVNYPVANIVLASHQYPYGQDIPAEDFWNLAGRAGRIEQGQVGVVALAAPDDGRADVLRQFVGRQVLELNSTLIAMVRKAIAQYGSIDLRSLSQQQSWSAFVQFLAHTYRQVGDPGEFANEVERILRGTLGFQALRSTNAEWAALLTQSVHRYAAGLTGKPLTLVDSTGFSWESVQATLARLGEQRITHDVWEHPIFGADSTSLAKLVGVMLQVPELRDNLLEISPGGSPLGTFVANVVHDWVNGVSLLDLSTTYFTRENDSPLEAMTRCCRRLFRDIAPTVAWGLSAMEAMTLSGRFEEMPEQRQRELRNLPSFAYYGVNTEEAVALRLLGVPRTAATALAPVVGRSVDANDATHETVPLASTVAQMRERLAGTSTETWNTVLGPRGSAYRTVWQIVDGSI